MSAQLGIFVSGHPGTPQLREIREAGETRENLDSPPKQQHAGRRNFSTFSSSFLEEVQIVIVGHGSPPLPQQIQAAPELGS